MPRRRFYLTLPNPSNPYAMDGEKVYYYTTNEPRMMRCDGGARDAAFVYIRKEADERDTGGWYQLDSLHEVKL